MNNFKRDFSIMEEIEVELKDNLSHLNLDVKDIFEKVEKVETTKDNVYHKEDIQPKEDTASLKVIDILQKEIEKKDKLIDTLTKQLEANTQLLNQQQQLSLADKKRILELESSFEDRQNERGSLWNRFCKWWNKDS